MNDEFGISEPLQEMVQQGKVETVWSRNCRKQKMSQGVGDGEGVYRQERSATSEVSVERFADKDVGVGKDDSATQGLVSTRTDHVGGKFKAINRVLSSCSLINNAVSPILEEETACVSYGSGLNRDYCLLKTVWRRLMQSIAWRVCQHRRSR